MLIWKHGQESLTEPREFWARGSVLPVQGRGSEFWGPCILSKCPFMLSEPGVFPGCGAELVLWAGSAGRGQRGVGPPRSGHGLPMQGRCWLALGRQGDWPPQETLIMRVTNAVPWTSASVAVQPGRECTFTSER